MSINSKKSEKTQSHHIPVSKHAAKVHAKKSKTKTIKIAHKHTKPYRKRHISLLAILLSITLALLFFLVIYVTNTNNSLKGAQDYVREVFGVNVRPDDPDANKQLVISTYGFQMAFDQTKYYATAVDAATGNLYLGNELATHRAYQQVRISPQFSDGTDNQVSLSVQYLNDTVADQNADLTNIENSYVQKNLNNDTSSLTKQFTEEVTINKKKFLHSGWQRQTEKNSLGANFSTHFSTYTGVLNGRPLVVVVNGGFGDDTQAITQFNDIIKSIKFDVSTQSVLRTNPVIATRTKESISLLNKLTFTGVADAAVPQVTASEKNSAKYSPAVVKIYNVYCMDIKVEGEAYLNNVCDGSTGSGFILTKDGYIATNGHVAFANPKDIVIKDAFEQLYMGDDQYFNYLSSLSGLTYEQLVSKSEMKDRLQLAIDKFYEIDDSKFTATNNVNNLLVDLNEKQPDLKELLSLTKARKEYAQQENIKHAKQVAANYRLIDGITAFRASDVAIIKIDGDNYPTVKLGSIDSVTQGANLSILGFPSQAGDNGITDSEQSKVTLTSGKVSSVKNAQGSDKKVIETDTTIGHGNSGGPVLSDEGAVIGLATYTSDGSGQGNGVFNYIRDVKDLKDLADKNSIKIDSTLSKTQIEWEKGLEYFYNARYSKAVKSFDKVKQLYPQHPKANEFIATAQQRIKNGEEVKDFPIIPVAVGVVVLLAGIGITVFFIIRHKKAHNVYKAQVAGGAMQPLQPGMPSQTVAYTTAAVQAINNPLANQQSPVAASPQAVTPNVINPTVVSTPQPMQQAPSAPLQQPGVVQSPVAQAPSVSPAVPGGVITPQVAVQDPAQNNQINPPTA